MLIVKLDKENSLALIEPVDALDVKDFQAAASSIDPLIEEQGLLNGLLIHSESFPGWDSFSALVSHLKFIQDHHTIVKRVALASDSIIARVVEALARHFVDAEIKHFAYNELEQAEHWLIHGE